MLNRKQYRNDQAMGKLFTAVNLQRMIRTGRRVFIGLAAVVLVAMPASKAMAVDCPSKLSSIDCGALLNDWTDWVPIVCGANGTPTQLVGNDNEQKIFNYFVGKGYTKEQAAGIIGNIAVESHGDPQISQLDGQDYQSPPNPTSPSLGWGIVQWTPAQKILSYASATGKPAYTLDTQVEFLWKQLEGTAPSNSEKPAGDALKSVTSGVDGHSTAWHAALVFLQYYERAADTATNGANAKLRGGLAEDALSLYGAQAPAVGSDTNSSNTPTCGATGNIGNVVFLSQRDERWAAKPMPYLCGADYSSIGDCGCYLTSVSMIASTLASTTVTPDTLSDLTNGNTQVYGVAQRFNLSVKEFATADLPKALAMLDAKHLILIHGHNGDPFYNTSTHWEVIRGVTSDGKVLVNDPWDLPDPKTGQPLKTVGNVQYNGATQFNFAHSYTAWPLSDLYANLNSEDGSPIFVYGKQ